MYRKHIYYWLKYNISFALWRCYEQFCNDSFSFFEVKYGFTLQQRVSLCFHVRLIKSRRMTMLYYLSCLPPLPLHPAAALTISFLLYRTTSTPCNFIALCSAERSSINAHQESRLIRLRAQTPNYRVIVKLKSFPSTHSFKHLPK